jgi:hypothetical protein
MKRFLIVMFFVLFAGWIHAADMKFGQICQKQFDGNDLPIRNAYYWFEFDGFVCGAPLSCKAWNCPQRVPDADWKGVLDKKTLVAEEQVRKFEEKLQSEYETRGRANSQLPAPVATVLRGGQAVVTGTLDATLLSQVQPGDRIDVGEGFFLLQSGSLPSSVMLVGKGEKTVIDMAMHALPGKGIHIQDMVLRNPAVPAPVEVTGTLLMVRVKVDMFASVADAPVYQNWNSVITIGGSFGRISPSYIHTLPAFAFNTHVGTLHHEGEYVDMEAFPSWIPFAPLRELFMPIPTTTNGKQTFTSSRKAFSRSPWIEPLALNPALVPAALKEVLPFDYADYQKGAFSVVKTWLSREYGLALAAAHPEIALMKKDMEASRPLSAFYRATLIPEAEFVTSEEANRHLLDARKRIVEDYDCHAWVNVDKTMRQNATVTSEWKQSELFSDQHDQRARELLPVARYGKASGARCRFVTRIGRDVFQEERKVTDARIEKTEWFISSQGLAKQKAAMDAALSNMGKGFEAAGAAMEKTWTNFDAYRTRIDTTQSGEQVLVSYTGDRNAANVDSISELARLRQQASSQSGPGAPGDYYAMTTYVVDVTRRYRHVFEMSVDTLYEGRPEKTGAIVRFDEIWSLPPCQNRFLDNSATVQPAGSDCFVQESPAIQAALKRTVADFDNHLKTVHIPRIDANIASRRQGDAAEKAEAALYTVLMNRPVSAEERAVLAQVFGTSASPEAIINSANALLATLR